MSDESTSSFEVEAKFALATSQTDGATAAAALRERLLAAGFVAKTPERHRDTYFAHPARDFAATDEALRLRQEVYETPGATSPQSRTLITYKGPREPGPVKSREEREVPLAGLAVSGAEMSRIFERLGFRPVRDVIKRREPFVCESESGLVVTVTIDEVDELGWFAEVERVITNESREETAERVLEVAASLGLPVDHIESRSYLAMLFER